MRGLKEVILVTWTESERGWGCRPDGATLHLTREDAQAFIKAHNESLPKDHVPDEYTRADNAGVPVLVDAALWARVVAASASRGFWMWQSEFREFERIRQPDILRMKQPEKPSRSARRKAE